MSLSLLILRLSLSSSLRSPALMSAAAPRSLDSEAADEDARHPPPTRPLSRTGTSPRRSPPPALAPPPNPGPPPPPPSDAERWRKRRFAAPRGPTLDLSV